MLYLRNFSTTQSYEDYTSKEFDRPLVANINVIGQRPKFWKDFDYLTFTAKANNSSVKLTKVGTPNDIPLEYRVNLGKWKTYSYSKIDLSLNDKIQFRNSSATIYNTTTGGNSANYLKFEMTGTIWGSGDVTSILKKSGGNVELGWYAFEWLFYRCTSLVKAPYFPSTVFTGQNAYRSIFYDNTGVKEYHFATLGNSQYVQSDTIFNNNSSAETLMIDDTVPAKISGSTLSGLKSTCKIYVPDSSVAAYKAAQYWSDRADYIMGISEKPIFLKYLETHGKVWFEIERTQSWPLVGMMRFSPASVGTRQNLIIYNDVETIYLNASKKIITSLTGTTSYEVNANDIVDIVEHPEWINKQGKWYYHASMRQNNASSWRASGSAYLLPSTTTSNKIYIFSNSYPPSEGTKLYFYMIADTAASTAAAAWSKTPNSNYVPCIYKGNVGLWDTKSDTFYENKGPGYAKAGPLAD